MSRQWMQSICYASAVLGLSLNLPLHAQEAGAAPEPAAAAPQAAPDSKASEDMAEVIVTARRVEERLQDVPISITVFNQQQLADRNVVSGADLATYTPSLSVNTRFGPDQPSFAIRGFTQELRTTASVGFYFADVVAPRGGGSITAGDGGGPGAFFDLQNVQVLKGPQGTLFGRNTTGGAILLVPQKPTRELGGYLEASGGDYSLQRLQGVLNVPMADWARARFGVDYQKRDGFLHNTSGIGPSDFNDMDYIAGRGSLVLDLAASLENYTIFSFVNSENNGSVAQMFACNSNASVRLASFCQAQLAAAGKQNFYDVANPMSDPQSKLKQWQAINTSTWTVNDDLTLKNIFSYADLNQTSRSAIFGSTFSVPAQVPLVGGLPFWFTNSDQLPGVPTNSQTSLVEELQLQGRSLNQQLIWQAGLYFESSRPDGFSGSQSPNAIHCASTPGSDPTAFECLDVLRTLSYFAAGLQDQGPAGNVQRQLGKVEYNNRAAYAQASYPLSETLKLTGGLRYTWDKTEGTSEQILYTAFPWRSMTDPAAAPGAPGVTVCVNTTATLPDCSIRLKQNSSAPTWLIDLDYKPLQNVLLYAKYARGYRQGSINLFGAQGFQSNDPEKVDAYEIGSKTSFDGPIAGSFDIVAFYNKLKDQQIQVGFSGNNVTPTTGVINAGASTIAGVEVSSMLKLTHDLSLDLAYTYLHTKLDELNVPSLPSSSVYNVIIPSALEGGELSFSPKHNATATLAYRLPLPSSAGQLSAAATYVYTASQISSASSPYGVMPSYELLNFNLNWKAIVGSPFDAALFVTNALDEEYTVFVPGLLNSLGAEYRNVGAPRMWGARLRYNFGS